MYAIIENGSKQYKVAVDDVVFLVRSTQASAKRLSLTYFSYPTRTASK